MNMLKRDINFFSVIGQDSSGFAIDFEKWLKISLAVFGVIAAVIVGFMFMVNTGLTLKRKGLEKDIAALEEPLKRVEELKTQSEQLKMDIDIFNQSIDEFNIQPRLTVDDIEQLAFNLPSTVTINSFSYGNGTVTLSCTGTSELAIADFVNSLRNSERKNDAGISEKDFAGVKYTGVSRNGDTFSSSVTVQLKSREPVEEEKPAEEETSEEGQEGESK